MIYLFNSIDFIFFVFISFSLYWLLPHRWKNPFLLFISYFFYASWDWRFLGLLLLSTLVNYACGMWMYRTNLQRRKNNIFVACLVINLAILFFFKYYNFFAESLSALLLSTGFTSSIPVLSIILPIGISFYTFQAMSYTIDLYRGKMLPVTSIIDFSLFIAYFPQLIAGPIERASRLLPLLQEEKKLASILWKEGAYLFIYGLFKKVVLADSAGKIANSIFGMASPSGGEVVIASIAFGIQIYCDFSGYSDMARGISHFFGIPLSRNFYLPYLSKTPSQFWLRWHITLSSWVKDYIYVPLGGRKAGRFGAYALFIAWGAMGLWHGASWHFFLWGCYWFTAILTHRVFFEAASKRRSPFPIAGIIKATTGRAITVAIAAYGWVIFRSESIAQAWGYTLAMVKGIALSDIFQESYWYLYVGIAFLAVYESILSKNNDEFFIVKKSFYPSLAFYFTLFFLFILIGGAQDVQFLYFQF